MNNQHLETGITPDAILDTAQAANHLGITNPQTLAVWRGTGSYSLPFVKVGRSIRYRFSDLDAWLESRARNNGATA
ncbi:hypothetical protein AGMMS50256_20710 [Betaproteobacteria bacterium]|nr:hypothetical protein AGMMS50256_20710 [Betaproteobacteria bacterium]